ncbi:MAG: tetratricopeptide repeat protein, partial [Acidobacteria bacterium]|nr:tetratricopeptide repeat protein [Acidobacteriota bacterium]
MSTLPATRLSLALALAASLAFADEPPKPAPTPALDPKTAAIEEWLDKGQAFENEGKAGSFEKAREAFAKARELAQAAGDVGREAKALDGLAFQQFSLGEKRKAIQMWEECVVLRRKAGDKKGEAFTLQGLGLAYGEAGEPKKALEIYDRALVLAREAGDRHTEGGLLNNIGGIHWRTDRMLEALGYYEKSLAISRERKNRKAEASTLSNIGDVYRRLGDTDRALSYFGQALAIRTEIKDLRGQGINLHQHGLVFRELGQLEKAREFFEKGLAKRLEAGDKTGEGYSYGGLGGITLALGDAAKALELEDKAIAIWKAMGNRAAHGEALSTRGDALLALGRRDEALADYREAASLASQAGDRTYEARALAGSARASRDAGNLEEARKSIDAAIAIVEDLRQRVTRQDLRTTYFGTVKSFYDLRTDILMRMHGKDANAGHDREAFRTVESSRARTLLEILAEARADLRKGADPALLARESAARLELDARDEARRKLLQKPVSAEETAAAEKALNEALTELENTRTAIRKASPSFAALSQAQPVDVAETQALLDDRSVLLSYSLGAESSWGFLVGRTSFRSFPLPGREAIEKASRQAYEALTARNTGPSDEPSAGRRARVAKADAAFETAASSLADMLLGGLHQEIAGTRLLVVKDGALAYVPFGALLLSAEGSKLRKPLVSTHEIVILPSASTLAALRTRTRVKPEETVAVLADPVFSRSDSRVAPGPPPAGPAGAEVDLRAVADLSGLTRLRFSR